MYVPRVFKWNDGMATGLPEIDDQHKYLINFINELGYSINKNYDPDDIVKVLKVMKFYAEWHFEKEEECMERYHCAFAGKNKKAHMVFTEKLLEHQKEYEKSGGSSELAHRIHEDLANWIEHHIMALDARLYSYTKPATPLET
jgi:hemerythrin